MTLFAVVAVNSLDPKGLKAFITALSVIVTMI